MRHTGFGIVVLLAGLRVDAQNALPDPAFASGVAGWTVAGSATSFQRLTLAGPDGVAGIGRLQVAGPGSGFAQTCVPVVAGQTYSWGGWFRPEGASADAILAFYPNATCQGATVVGQFFGPLAQSSLGWQFEPGLDVVAPPTSGSVLFRIAGMVPGGTGAPGTVDVDDVYFGPQGTGPPGLADVPALSRGVLLALALVLAVAGTRLVRAL